MHLQVWNWGNECTKSAAFTTKISNANVSYALLAKNIYTHMHAQKKKLLLNVWTNPCTLCTCFAKKNFPAFTSYICAVWKCTHHEIENIYIICKSLIGFLGVSPPPPISKWFMHSNAIHRMCVFCSHRKQISWFSGMFIWFCRYFTGSVRQSSPSKYIYLYESVCTMV